MRIHEGNYVHFEPTTQGDFQEGPYEGEAEVLPHGDVQG